MRKGKHVFVVFLLLIALSGLFSVSSASSGSDWPMFRHDLTHSGCIDSNSSSNSAELQWGFPTSAAVISSPAVADGYTIFGCKDCHIYCLNASTGEMMWSFPTGHEVNSSPAISDGLAFVGCDDGWVYCMNISNGLPVWIETAGGLVRSSPAVADGRVYVGSGLHGLYCFNASTGDTLWTFPTKYRIQSSPAVVAGVAYFASDDFYLYAVNASTGQLIWSQFTGSDVASPSVYDGCIYIGTYTGGVTCLNASSSAVVWQAQTLDTVESTPATAYGRIYVGSEDGALYCFNASSGQKLWQTPTKYWVWSSPAIANGEVYVGSQDNRIYCFDAFSGEIKWTYQTMSLVDSSPAIVDGVLYVGSSDYHLYALKLSNATAATANPAVPLAWSTIVFDGLTAAAWLGALGVIIRFLYLNRKNRQTKKSARPNFEGSWFSAHINNLCALSILVFAVVFFLSLNSPPMWAADEKTYSQMAYHLTTSGDYLYPWAYGEQAIWAGKPPLLMWLMSFSYQFLGVSNVAARIWMPVFAVSSLAVTFFLGKKLHNAEVGFFSVLVLGTFSVFYQFATHAMTDGPLLFFMLASIYFALLSEEKRSIRFGVVSGVFFGLALMTKQIEALLIPLILIVYWLATKRSVRFTFTKWFTAFWGAAAVLFLPWVAYMAQRFRDFWDCYFVYSDFNRIVSPLEGHNGDYLFYINYLVTHEPVWTVLLPFAIGLCIYNIAKKRSKADTLILSWIAIVLALFTVAQTKLYWYILPAVPAFALAIGSLLNQIGTKLQEYHHNRKKKYASYSLKSNG